jgi:hypothetical protein
VDAGFVSVIVEVDRPRELRIDFNTICEAEKVTGLSFLQDWTQSISAQGLRALCWASWKKQDPNLTLEQAGLIVGAHVHVITEKLTEAWLKALPEQDGSSTGDPTRPTTTPPS